ncbi:hypothetical protein P152DRAFT_460961 [Eremomyces bilateralis CBS 781.70]|uniref:Uncharacterized protein n=1 Tax=Eremomyces bilateralis CBS 781.70 TaxID=1392243 RepID=A0A6G1FVW5_9PEZI|nr:uncharacterized protein P152DRAFT_460961 [Eremomyces bilateralis CBS 781.70]KAF1809858.1 hypothetical protein P152DRAFT_460961 [Eremomyces bilateralis CBS 781.70]
MKWATIVEFGENDRGGSPRQDTFYFNFIVLGLGAGAVQPASAKSSWDLLGPGYWATRETRLF